MRVRHPNVLWIIADALRADRLHCYGNPWPTSPVMDRLAREGVLFQRCIAHSAHTLPCVVSAFTGLDPMTHGLRDPRTHASHSWGGWVTPLERIEREGYAVAGADDWIYFHLGRRARPRNAAELKAFFDAHRDEPFFAWSIPDHCHLPYDPPPPYDTLFLPPGFPLSDAARRRLEIVRTRMIVHRSGLISQFELDEQAGGGGDTHSGGVDRDMDYRRTAGTVVLEPEDRLPVAALYNGKVRLLDEQIGEYVRHLENLGLLDGTILLVTGDHGEELLERGSVGHTSCSLAGTLYDEAIHVPLIIRYPPALPAATVVERQVSQADLMPTVAELLGVSLEADVEGRSLLPLVRGQSHDRAEETFATTLVCGWQVLAEDRREVWCLRTPRWKLLHYTNDPTKPDMTELFDLAADPRETRNLRGEYPEIARVMQGRLDAWRAKGPCRFLAAKETS
jgi:arylsulfatase A-like enzyme